jgi:hypothetical protein
MKTLKFLLLQEQLKDIIINEHVHVEQGVCAMCEDVGRPGLAAERALLEVQRLHEGLGVNERAEVRGCISRRVDEDASEIHEETCAHVGRGGEKVLFIGTQFSNLSTAVRERVLATRQEAPLRSRGSPDPVEARIVPDGSVENRREAVPEQFVTLAGNGHAPARSRFHCIFPGP